MKAICLLLAPCIAFASQARRAELVVFDNAESSLVHFPSRSMTVLSENEVAETLARVMGTESPVAHSGNTLPSGDLFNKPAVNLLFTIEDFEKNSSSKVNSMISSKQTYTVEESSDSVGFPTSLLHGTKPSGRGLPDIVQQSGAGEQPMVMCVSSNKVAAAACDVGSSVAWSAKARRFESTDGSVWAAESDLKTALAGKHSLAGVLQAVGGEVVGSTIGVKGASFDLATDMDLEFFLELFLFTSLPNKLFADANAAQKLADSSTDLLSLTFSSLKSLGEYYGRDSAQYSAAQAVVDEAAFKILNDFEELLPEKLVVELLLVDHQDEAQKSAAAASRRLLAINDQQPLFGLYLPQQVVECIPTEIHPCPPSSADIANWNIFFWMFLFLAFILSMSVCGLCNMELGRDSLLYAKFQTEIIDKRD